MRSRATTRWKKAALTTALLLAATGALAQDAGEAGRQQLATQMLQAMRGEQMIEQLASVFFQSIADTYRARMATAGSCPAAEKVLDEQSSQSRRLMMDAFKEGDYLGKVTRIYARTFTEAELQDAIAFFRSATGQKFLDKQPELMQQGAALGQAMVGAKQAELQALSTRLDASMKTALEGCRPANP